MMTPRLTTMLSLLALAALAEPPLRDAGAPTAARLLDDAKQARKDGDHRRAIKLLTQCLSVDSKSADCTVALASEHATVFHSSTHEADGKKAVELYQRFLTLASPDDPRVARVRAILAGGDVDFPPPGAPNVITDGTTLPVEERMTLVVGERRVVNVPNVVRLAVSNDQIVDIKVMGNGDFELSALKAGSTTLLFQTTTGQLTSTITVASKK